MTCDACGRSKSEVNRVIDTGQWLCLRCFNSIDHPGGRGATEPSERYEDNLVLSSSSVDNGSLAPPAMLVALGVESPIETEFDCILPGHEHRAVVRPAQRGERGLRYCCDEGMLGLGEVRAAMAGRSAVSPVEAARWRERLLFEAGLRVPRPVVLPIPARCSTDTRRVLDALQLFVGLRDERWGDEPFPFAREFARAYVGELSDKRYRTAVTNLKQCGALIVASQPQRRTRKPILWMTPAMARSVAAAGSQRVTAVAK